MMLRRALSLLLVQLGLVCGQSDGSDANCSSHEKCLEILAHVTSERQKKEVEALELVGRAKITSEKATESQVQSRASLDRAQAAEEEQAKWQDKADQLREQLRSLDFKLQSSTAAQEEAVAAAKREVAAKNAALEDQKHEAAMSTMPAQERCLADFASCTAGLISLQVQQWMACLHMFNRFFVACGSILLGLLLLLSPADGQAIGFAFATLVIVPVLVAGAFKDFLRLVGSPPALLVILAGLLTMVIAVAFLWQGADGLRLLLGAGLAVLFGDLLLVILHELLPVPPILVALSALALGLFGAAAGLQRRSATEAFAMAVPAALLVASGVVLIFSLALSPEAYLEDVAFELVPWAHYGDKVGSFFCTSGRLLWLVLQLPALIRLLLASPDVPVVLPWKSERPQEATAQQEEPQDARDERDERDVEKSPGVAQEELWANTEAGQQARAEAAAAADAAVPEGELDPVATTQLLQRTVQALQALENSLPPSTALAGVVEADVPPTHLAQARSGTGR